MERIATFSILRNNSPCRDLAQNPVPGVASLQPFPRGEPFGLGLAFLLSGSAGAVDVIAYLQFERVFVANMTGNTVLFASHLAFHQLAAALRHLLPILGFLAGIVVARLLRNRIPPHQAWGGPSPAAGLCFLLASGLWTLIGVLTPSLTSILIPVLAFSMGAQNAAFTRVGNTPLNTAFITGDLEKFAEALANLISFRQPDAHEERLKLRAVACIWVAYVIGAALGALLSQSWGKRALLCPAAALCLSAGLAFVFWCRARP
jgi:uncharacterized membrane protein YoaK (UPF0700 family)